jgi:hypothetical protein
MAPRSNNNIFLMLQVDSLAGSYIKTAGSPTYGQSIPDKNYFRFLKIPKSNFLFDALPDMPGQISGLSSICIGQGNVNYSVPLIPNATDYSWNYSGTGFTISNQGSRLISLSLSNSATSGNLSVKGINSCGVGETSEPFEIAVIPISPASVSIVASRNPVCAGTSVTYTAIPVNGGSAPAYQWKVNGDDISGATNSNFTFIPNHNNTIACNLFSNSTCVTGNPVLSNTITMTVNSQSPVSVLITTSANPVCAGTLVTYTANPVNGGSTPVYQWKVNGQDVLPNSQVYSYIPANNDKITCVLTSNATCAIGSPATSNEISMTVNSQLPVSVSIVASENPVCAGTLVTYAANPVNGGSTPVYQWKVNGQDVLPNSQVYSYIPANNDKITCVLTSNATCATGSPATSNEIDMVVNPLLPVSVSIAATQNPVCAGTIVAFTATPINGGINPVYNWKVNGQNVGDNNPYFMYIPMDNDTITCILNSNATCSVGSPAISNQIILKVNPMLPVNVVVAPSANPVCAGIPVIFVAAITNGGSSPTYQWPLLFPQAAQEPPQIS